MATILKKAVLKDGVYHSRDGVVNVTPQRRQRWADNFQKMRAANAHIPMSWDHATDEKQLLPVVGDRTAENTVGELLDVTTTKDGIELSFQITDPKAAERAARNEIYVSPVIFDKWQHSNGETFKDCFTHVDLVNHPVDHSQGPFTEVAVKSIEPGHVACCLRMGLSQPFTLMGSDDHYYGDKDFIRNHDGSGGGKAKPKKGRKGKGKKRRKMSLSNFIRMGDEVEFDYDEDDEGEFDDDESDTETEEQSTVDQLVTGNEEGGGIEETLKLLAAIDVVLPDDTTDENFQDRLRTALHIAVAMKNKAKEEEAAAAAASEPEEEKLKVESPLMQTMSLQVSKLQGKIEKSHREKLSAEIEGLLKNGQCTPKEANEKKAALAVVRMSLDNSGDVKSGELDAWVESRKPLPKGTFWDATQRLSLSAVEHPPSLRGEEFTQQQGEEYADWMMGRGPNPRLKIQ